MKTDLKLDCASRALALLFFVQWVVFQFMLRDWDRSEVAARFFLGNDFEYLYSAAGHFLSGKSPYTEINFIPLPSALYLPLSLHSLSFWNALIAFRVTCFLLVICAMLWLCHQLRVNALNSALIMVVTLTYGPFYTVLVGGNLDALMLALLVFACARRRAVRGIFLALSIGTKFYSLLLVPVLALRRRWRELLWAAAMLALLLLPFIRFMSDAILTVLHRTSVLRLDSNESPAVLFILLFGEKQVWLWRSCYILLWGGTLSARLVADCRNSADTEAERFRTLDYIPWMAAAPVLVFTYTGTILLPVIACLIRKNQDRRLNWAEWTMVSGFLLTGLFPLFARSIFSTLFSIFRVSNPQMDHMLMTVAPLGVSAILIGSSVAAWKALRAVQNNQG